MAGTAFRLLMTLFLVGVALQFFLAGLGVMKTRSADSLPVSDSQFSSYFHSHSATGDALMILSVVVLLVALIGRLGRRRVLVALALSILVLLQPVFVSTGPGWFPVLHVLNGFVIAGVAGWLTRILWQEHREASALTPA